MHTCRKCHERLALNFYAACYVELTYCKNKDCEMFGIIVVSPKKEEK